METIVKDWFKRKLKDGTAIRKLFLQPPTSCPDSRLVEALDLRPTEFKQQPTGKLIIEKGELKLEGEFDKGDFDLRPIARFSKLVRHLPFFPKPWQKLPASLRVEAIQRLADRHIVASGRPIPPLSIYGKDDMAFWMKMEFWIGADQSDWRRFDDFLLHIDWDNYDRKAIEDEFARWLSREAMKRLKKRRHGGHTTPSPEQRLKYLCALRLCGAGLSFSQIQKLLNALPNRENPDALAVLPLHKSSSAFSRDICKAKAYLAELFPIRRKY
ncbi:MAG: hypothetical protein HY735_24335 [Verrucomicrobia bacterium]|nr:hypothetical protein [Verrucomicrobiota bacterium]